MAPLAFQYDDDTSLAPSPHTIMEGQRSKQPLVMIPQSTLPTTTTTANTKTNREQQKRRPNRRVTFAVFDKVYEVCSIDDMSDDEFRATYASHEELVAIKMQCRLYIQAMEDGRVVDLLTTSTKRTNNNNKEDQTTTTTTTATSSLGVTLRGLESYVPSNVQKRKFQLSQLYDVVDEIQCFQDRTGLDVADMMAQICEKFSRKSVEEALMVGASDALAAAADE